MPDSLRSRNSFDFESNDEKFPYSRTDGVSIGTRKFVLFNYSPEYYGRKQAGTSGLYYLRAGNIPQNMSSSLSLSAYQKTPNGSEQVTPKPDINCDLLRGIAKPLGEVKYISPASSVINLSPNHIIKVPTVCNQPWPDQPEILYEKARQQKPNHLYFPAYQPSCSTHPRARGYAHEDNYDCLKLPFGSGSFSPDFNNTVSTCCDQFCDCQFRSFIISDGRHGGFNYPSGSFYDSGLAGLTINPVCCKTLKKEYPNDPATIAACGNTCNFGYNIVVGGRAAGLLCPKKTIKNKEYTTWFASEYHVFQAGGNEDCGCGGTGGTVTVNGSMVCTTCTYQPSLSDGIIINPDPDMPPDSSFTEVKCVPQQGSSFSGIVCSCLFNEKISIVDYDVYITTLNYPTFKFPNGQLIDINDNGVLTTRGCEPEPRTCDDLN